MVEHGAASLITKPDRETHDSLRIKIETPNKFDDSDLINTAIPSASKLLNVADFGSFDPSRRDSISTQHYGAIIANSTKFGNLENKIEDSFSKLEDEIHETGKKLREASVAVDAMQQALSEDPTLRPHDIVPVVQEVSEETSTPISPRDMSPISEEFHTPTSSVLHSAVQEFVFPPPKDNNIADNEEADKSTNTSEAAGNLRKSLDDTKSDSSSKKADDTMSEASSSRRSVNSSRYTVNLGLRKTSIMVQQDAMKDFVDDSGTKKTKILFRKKLQETREQIKDSLKKVFKKDKH